MSATDILVGVDSCHYALLTTDLTGSIAYETPVAIPGLVSISAKANNSEETLYADNGPYATNSAFGGIDLEIEIAETTLELYATLTGATYSGGQLYQSSADTAPYIALMFRALKSDGNYRYFALLKGKLTPADEDFATKTEKTTYQTVKFSGTFINRTYVEVTGDIAGKTLYKKVSDTGTNWFTAANLTGASIDALTCTPVPADGAGSIEVTANLTWTYNNAIDDAYASGDYFSVSKADGAAVAGAVSIDATCKVVTFNPTESLAGSTVYIATASNAVKDVYGQKVGANTVTNFTTS